MATGETDPPDDGLHAAEWRDIALRLRARVAELEAENKTIRDANSALRAWHDGGLQAAHDEVLARLVCEGIRRKELEAEARREGERRAWSAAERLIESCASTTAFVGREPSPSGYLEAFAEARHDLAHSIGILVDGTADWRPKDA